MNSRIAVALGLAAILAALLTPLSTLTPAFATTVTADITSGSATKTNDAFAPNPISAQVGDTVTWTNKDTTIHTVVSGSSQTPDGKFDSSNGGQSYLAGGQTFSHTFTEAGDYPYYCTLHPLMVGTVVVSAGNGGPQPFTVTATDSGNSYEISGTSDTATATAATIVAGQSVEVEFDGPGTVELTLPKAMIRDITTVNGEEVTIVSQTDAETTISFEVPEGETTATILAGFVVPEFPVIAAILAATIAGIIGYTRFAKSETGFLGRA
jgi:plastocyanin